MGGEQGIGGHRWSQGDPTTLAIGLKLGHFQSALLEQLGVSWFERIAHNRRADEAIEMAPMAIAAEIHHQGLADPGAHHQGLTAGFP
ncbi:MAG: hypothetical protein RLZZ609_2931 [Cyanobacteriota bacterium]|jgi:hypothetical protein